VRKLHLLLLPAVLLALVFGLTACGGATGDDPTVCEETQTQAFMEQTTGSSGKDAVKECEKEAESGEGQPDSVNVTGVKIDGSSATADAEFKGGPFDSQTLQLALVEEDGDWKLDELTGFANFDPQNLIDAFSDQIEKEPGIEPEIASCLTEGLEGLSNPELESIVIEDNTEVFGELAEGCQGQS
jgi:ABC-type glycerol-3-phosphate transport system substrate-binding protein